MSDRREIPSDALDEGVTLIELLFYMFLAVSILAIVGGLLINSLRVEAQVRDGVAATDSTQLVTQSLGRGIRNASALEVSQPSSGAVLLRTRSINSSVDGATWQCNAWHVDASGEVRWTTSDSAIPANPTAAELGSWTLLGDGLTGRAARPILSYDPSERAVDVSFSVRNGEGAPVVVDSTIVSRQPVPATGEVRAPCL